MTDMPKMEGEQTHEAPRVFVSYAHESPEHKNWVKTLAADLRRHGVDALLDDWKVVIGADFTLFMDSIRTCDRVLLICTPAYARKANEGEGGVGYERSVITAELAANIDTSKFKCVLRDGTRDESIPTFARSRRYIDFRKDVEYDVRLDELSRDLHNAPADPEPPLGPNPYAEPSQPSEPASVDVRSIDETDPNVIAEHAETLLSRRDLIGWKRLLRRARAAIQPRLLAWRADVRDTGLSDEDWRRTFAEGVRICEPLVVLALTAVDSEIESISDQRGLIDDFVSLDAWERSGNVFVIGMPIALAFMYHHVLGAFLIASAKHDGAIQLLSTTVRAPERAEACKLWEEHELMGWPASLGKDYFNASKFLRSLFDERPWMRHFFHSRSSFVDSMRAYGLMASMLELATFLGHGRSIEKSNDIAFLDVPVTFVMPEPDTSVVDVDKIIRKAIPSRGVLDSIAEAGGTNSSRVREAWPAWISQWAKIIGRSYHIVGSRLEDLAEQPPPLP